MRDYILKFKKGAIYGLALSIVVIFLTQLLDVIESGFTLRNIWDYQKILLVILIPVISYGLLALTPWGYIWTDYSKDKEHSGE